MDNCVFIGHQNISFCNITYFWTPTISQSQATVTMIFPTLTAVLLIAVAYSLCGGEIRKQTLKEIYYRNKLLIYFKEYAGKEMYNAIKSGSVPEKTILFIRNPGQDWQTYEVWSKKHPPGSVYENKDELYLYKVSAKLLKYIQNICTPFFCKCLTFPKCTRMMLVTASIFIIPAIKLLWDVIDVGVDCFYFARLERGLLIDKDIARNNHVSNAILAFAILGALKSPLLSYGIAKTTERQTIYDNTVVKFLSPMVVSVKIVFEDCVELFLEYFYVDKYVTESQPWLLILKDVVSACIYIMPLLSLVMSGWKDFDRIQNRSNDVCLFNLNLTFKISDWWHVYITFLAVHVTFSVVATIRIFGMIFQYSRQSFHRECLHVIDGRLEQTPFHQGCLNGFDYAILFCMSVLLLIVSFAILIICGQKISKSIGRKFNKTRFLLNGVESQGRSSNGKLVYLHGYYRIKNHFDPSHLEFRQWMSRSNQPRVL